MNWISINPGFQHHHSVPRGSCWRVRHGVDGGVDGCDGQCLIEISRCNGLRNELLHQQPACASAGGGITLLRRPHSPTPA